MNLMGPNCNSWGLPARGTSKRSYINAFGAMHFDFVHEGNTTISRTLVVCMVLIVFDVFFLGGLLTIMYHHIHHLFLMNGNHMNPGLPLFACWSWQNIATLCWSNLLLRCWHGTHGGSGSAIVYAMFLDILASWRFKPENDPCGWLC